MLKKIAGFRDTKEAEKVMAAIEYRAGGALIFAQDYSKKPAPQAPSL